jgi:hypothetical protein
MDYRSGLTRFFAVACLSWAIYWGWEFYDATQVLAKATAEADRLTASIVAPSGLTRENELHYYLVESERTGASYWTRLETESRARQDKALVVGLGGSMVGAVATLTALFIYRGFRPRSADTSQASQA